MSKCLVSFIVGLLCNCLNTQDTEKHTNTIWIHECLYLHICGHTYVCICILCIDGYTEHFAEIECFSTIHGGLQML